jgi:PST family polysaccharide transporter
MREKLLRGVAWTSIANLGGQFLSFVVYIGLARMLNPRAFGLVSIAAIYIAFIQVFVTQGFSSAIIQRKDLVEQHLNSAFWIAIATASFFCGLSLLLAGTIAHSFREPSVAPIIKWLSLSFMLYALSAVPTAILNRELRFGTLAIRSLLAIGAGGATGLALALMGAGVWSLVGQQLVGAALGCLCLWWAVPWRPRLQVSIQHLRDLYRFSISLTGNELLWFFSQKSDQTVVGYTWGPLALGPYSIASRIVNLLHDATVGPSQSVLFPALSRLQSDSVRLAGALYQFCEISSFVLLPLFIGLAAVAPELVPVLFGAKWVLAVPLVQILGFYGATRVLLSFMHPLMLAKGRVGSYLVMNIVLSSLTIICCVSVVHFGPKAVALAMVFSMLVFEGVFLGTTVSRLEISARRLLKSFAHPVLLSLIMFIIIAFVRNLLTRELAPTSVLVISIAAGVAGYIAAALVVKPGLVRTTYEMIVNSVRLSSLPSDARMQAEAVLAADRESEQLL